MDVFRTNLCYKTTGRYEESTEFVFDTRGERCVFPMKQFLPVNMITYKGSFSSERTGQIGLTEEHIESGKRVYSFEYGPTKEGPRKTFPEEI